LAESRKTPKRIGRQKQHRLEQPHLVELADVKASVKQQAEGRNEEQRRQFLRRKLNNKKPSFANCLTASEQQNN